MKHSEAIDILTDTITALNLPILNAVQHLQNSEPIIYLCGKSTSGKTTFLNALLNMERDELFTSTNISTKTAFRFKYGETNTIVNKDDSVLNIPDSYLERKELFKLLNNSGQAVSMFLNQSVLKNRTIVDIPGVFDFEKKNEFSNQMLDEADVVYFLTPCTSKINASEKQLLLQITEAKIPIVVLFTMGDLTEVDQGITRKTIPSLVQSRIDENFEDINVAHYQIISSNDFYKNRDSHGIDLLQRHIEVNDQKYKHSAEQHRLERINKKYIHLIEDELARLMITSKEYEKIVLKESKLWFRTEEPKLKNDNTSRINTLKSQLNWLSNSCDTQIFGTSYQKIYVKQGTTSLKQFRNFESNWSEFWESLNEEFDFYKNSPPRLPSLSEDLFKQIDFDLDTLKEALGMSSVKESKTGNSTIKNNKDSISNSSNTEKSTTSKSQDIKEDKTESRTNKNGVKIDAEKSKVDVKKNISLTNFIEIAVTVGINISNANIIYKKWSYLNQVENVIDDFKNELIKNIELEFDTKLQKLIVEQEERFQAGLKEDPTIELKTKFRKALNQLNTI